MREILFRGKTKDRGWCYGHLVAIDDAEVYILETDPRDLICDVGLYAKRVDPETVGQYTGLKDKNGKKIFEGDILEEWHFSYFERLLITYTDSSFQHQLILPRKHDCFYPIDDIEFGVIVGWYEVVGNIHDNPELLEASR